MGDKNPNKQKKKKKEIEKVPVQTGAETEMNIVKKLNNNKKR